MNIRILLINFALLLLLSGCSNSNISGNYIAKFNNAVLRLQLVKSQDGHLAGQYDVLMLNASGKVEYHTSTVAGSIDGDNITLILGSTVSISGTYVGNKLSVTGNLYGDKLSTTVFERGDIQDFQKLVEGLNAQSQSILTKEAMVRQEKMARDFIAELNQTIDRLQKFDSAAGALLNKLPQAEYRYQQITEKMKSYLHRMKELSNSQKYSVARGQIDVAINQGRVASNQVHGSIQASQTDFQTNAQPLITKVTDYEQSCHLAKKPSPEMPPESQEWNSHCLKLIATGEAFMSRVSSLSKLFNHLESVYKSEDLKQDQIGKESQSLL